MCDGISGQQTARWRCCCGHGKCGGVRSQCKSDYHLLFSLPEPRAFAIREAADAFKLHSSVQWPVGSQHSTRSPAKQTAPNGRGAGGKHTINETGLAAFSPFRGSTLPGKGTAPRGVVGKVVRSTVRIECAEAEPVSFRRTKKKTGGGEEAKGRKRGCKG